jgi:2-aminobenzoate-CoA ligase
MPLLRSRELAHILRKADVQFALCDARLGDELAAAAPARPGLRTVHFGTSAWDGLEARMAEQTSDFENVIPSHDDVALIAFTSGTTGPAKATAHFHRDLLAICDALPRAALSPTADDVFAGSAPFAFTFGLGAMLLFPLRFGASAVLLEHPTPAALLNAIQSERVSILFTVPTLYRAMTPLVADFDLASLRTCISSGEHLPKSVFDGWTAATGIPLTNSIGSTEMLHAFVAMPPGDHPYGPLGRALPGYRTAVLSDDMTELPPGEVGRLAVRGPTGCRYLDDEPRQRTYVRNGWNLMGDAVSADENGTLTYHARTDDMIVSAGYNISGPEIEEALLTHPAVRECAVVGLPDPARGQVVAAFVVASGASDADGLTAALQDHVKAAIAPYKYPRVVVLVPELPKTASGKIQRHVLRERGAGDGASMHQAAAVHVDRAAGHE